MAAETSLVAVKEKTYNWLMCLQNSALLIRKYWKLRPREMDFGCHVSRDLSSSYSLLWMSFPRATSSSIQQESHVQLDGKLAFLVL